MHRKDLLNTSFECSCGKTHSVPVRRFVVEPGALEQTACVLQDLDLEGTVFLIADPTTYEVAGRRVVQVLEGADFTVTEHLLPERPKASDTLVQRVNEAYRGSNVIVSCGSGTVTDVAKAVAHERGVPLVAVATAPSMNGYASSIAALYQGGVKISKPITPVIAVIADVDVLAQAPLEMIRAGLGDALAKSVCNADWKLAHMMRGQHFCGMAFSLMRDLEAVYLERAADLAERDPTAIAALIESLLYSGVFMILAGSSAPASGGEHLISHTLDMHARHAGREMDFHGAQVGVATLVTSQLYDRFMELDGAQLGSLMKKASGMPSESDVEKRVRSFFGDLADNVMVEYRKKRFDEEGLQRDRTQLVVSWDAIREEVRTFLMPSASIRKVLNAAGCKTGHAELGVDRPEFSETAYLARTIRPRFNILDVAWELGVLEDFIQEAI